MTGTIAETEYLPYFQVSLMVDEAEYQRLQPTNQEELQEALSYVVKQELGSSSTMRSSTEAQKAQAVAAYSYILNYVYTTGNPYPVTYKPFDKTDPNDKKIYDAVGDVLGVKLLKAGQTTVEKQLISTTYFASSCGYTASSEKVWGGSLSWAKAVDSPYDNQESLAQYGQTFSTTVTLSRGELRDKIVAWIKKTAPAGVVIPESQFEVPDGALPFRDLTYDGDGTPGNYVYKTNFYYLSGVKKIYLTGANIRSALGLRSHCFEVTEYDSEKESLTLLVKGWGHGVGLSQMGAVGYANEAGWNYVQILRHYYSITDDSEQQIVRPVW